MCGIVGIIDSRGAINESTIRRMADTIQHRGPDGNGYHVQDGVGLGHRRLSIIDLENGQQPMHSADGKCTLVYNGELYNFQALKEELSAAGHSFRTHSDTEVILAAYQAWGTTCVERFRGMFAFALHDHSEKRVFLARDPLGIKPLYYSHVEERVCFASEIRAISQVPGFDAKISPKALDAYLKYQYIPQPDTVFENMYCLPPGNMAVVSVDNPTVSPKPYWQVKYQPEHLPEADWLERLEDAVKESVDAHLVADVPFGAFLSGGIDSTLVVSYMQEILQQPVKTFTIGFEEKEYSELDYARQAAKQLGTEHYEEIVKPDALAVLDILVDRYGQPFGDSSAIPTYYVSKLASEHVKMVLTGDGADEAFAGYHSYTHWQKYLAYEGSAAWKRPMHPLMHLVSKDKYPLRKSAQGWQEQITYYAKNARQAIWQPDFVEKAVDQYDYYERAYKAAGKTPMTWRAQYTDMQTYLPGDILTKVDVASMANSLETRTPLTDKSIWELAAKIPTELNFAQNSQGQWQSKRLLKKILAKKFDSKFVHRPKQGFGVPLKHWFAPKGPLYDFMQAEFEPKEHPLYQFLNPKVVQPMVAKGEYPSNLWLLLFLSRWLKKH